MIDGINLPHNDVRSTKRTKQAEIENETHNAFGEIDDLAFIQPKNLPGPSPTPSQCAKVVWLAQRCEVRRCFEAQWNSSVHNYVLDLAIHNAGFREKVYFLNWFGCSRSK